MGRSEPQVVINIPSIAQPFFQNRTVRRAPGKKKNGTNSVLDAVGHAENNRIYYVFTIQIELIEPMRIWPLVYNLLNFLYSYH